MDMTLLLLGLVVLLAATAEAQVLPPDPARVEQVAAMLPDAPQGLGRPITDREAWDTLAATAAYQAVIERAEKLLAQPLPEQPDDLYLDFSRTGNRRRYESVAFARRRTRLNTLVLAECAENRGRFLPAIEEVIAATCAERTWVLPAHDRSLVNFNRERVDIDLFSSEHGWQLATTNWLLGERLSPQTRALIRDNVDERVLEPFRAMYSGEREPNGWLRVTSNWNAVCLAGVTGAALAQIEDRRTRAEFITAAEQYSRNFLAGFTADGYCSEGLGYWNYGFGHYVLLAETVRQATGGGVDLMDRPGVAAPATFGARIQIIGGVSPAFADCAIGARPDRATMFYVNRRYTLGLNEYDALDLNAVTGSLSTAMIFGFPNSATEGATIAGADATVGLRTWFGDAGILIGRPAPGSGCRLGVALKGGHNAEHHNHNDVGSYVVVVEDRAVLLDPGSEVYTSRTFSAQRYESLLLNSFGHPVPVVAGQLQRAGRDAAAQVLASEFTDARDTLTLDLRSAYDVPELTRLERSFVYDRTGAGVLTVTDTVEFAEPRSFETALITDGDFVRREDGTLFVWDFNRAVEVAVDSGGADWELVVDEIHEEATAQPTRLGIRLSAPVSAATVTVTIRPTDLGRDAANLLLNGDFELGSFGWSLAAGSQGEISEERAHSGARSLKITDPDAVQGSNVVSAPIEAGPGRYLLRGQAWHQSGSGVGMYVRFYDESGARINETDERGWISPVGSLEGAVGEWAAFEFPFEAPAGTVRMDLWIHSYTAAQVEAYLDDLEIVPAD